MSRTGQYLTGLRNSSAAGIHIPTGTRGADRRDAITEQLADMEDEDMTELKLVGRKDEESPEEVLAIGYDDEDSDPTDDEILLIGKEEPVVDEEFASLMADYGLTPDGREVEDYVPETPSGHDDYRVFDVGTEEDYEWTE